MPGRPLRRSLGRKRRPASPAARSDSPRCHTEHGTTTCYPTAVTDTLTGLDSSPPGPGAEHPTIVIALGGVALFGYLTAQAVESIAREVTGMHGRTSDGAG